MNNLAQLEMTLDEARETDRLIKRHINTTRYLLLDMRDRKGWKALGYESFKEYGERELGYKETHIYQLVDAAEISLQLGYSPDSAMAESQPKERHLRPLKPVPEESRKEIWEEATRKAEEENAKLTAKRVEEAVEEWKQRSEEWRDQYIKERNEKREAQQQIELLKSAEPEKPKDYEEAKQQAAKLTQDLASLKKKQDELIQQQVAAKLREREKEIANLDRQANEAKARLESLHKHIDSYSSIERMTRLQRDQIEKTRSTLAELAANMEGFSPIENDKETAKLWDSLADMLRNGAVAIDYFRGRNSIALPRQAA